MAFLILPWGRLHYEAKLPSSSTVGASEPPLLFLHGSGCSSEDWSEILPRLPTSIPVITMDFRSHGASDAPATQFGLEDLADDTLALLSHLDIRRAILVGHSLGGMVAIAAARQSVVPAGLILLEGWTSLWAAAKFGGDRFFGKLPYESVKRIQQQSAAVRERFQPGHWDIFWESVVRFDGYPCLESTPLPVYEVYGAMGRQAGTEQKLLVPSRDNIRWVWLENAGHYLPAEKPQEIASLCSDMADTVRKGAGQHGQVNQ